MFTVYSSQFTVKFKIKNSKFKIWFTACCLLFLLAMPAVSLAAHFVSDVSPNLNATAFIGSFSINGLPAKPGDEIAFFDPQGVLCGRGTVLEEGRYGPVYVYGDDSTTSGVDEGASSGDILTVKIWDNTSGIELEGAQIVLTAGPPLGNSFQPSPIPPTWQDQAFYVLNVETATHFLKPNTSQYSTWIDFMGNITIKGQSAEIGDEVAVFDASGTIIGQYLITTPGQYGTVGGAMHVYRSEAVSSGKPLNFKLWDKRAGIEYPMSNLILRQGTPTGSFIESPIPPVWTDNKAYALDIEIPQGSVSQFIITFNTGWNFVSTPIQPTDPKIESVLAGVDVNVVWAYNGQTKIWKKYKASAASNELTTIDAGVGYWIYMNSAAQLAVYGTDASPSIRLYEGWNLIGYNGVDNAGIETKLSSITENWSIIWNWQGGVWKLNRNSNPIIPFPSIFSSKTLTKLNRGKAYWVKVKTATEWQQ